MKPLLPTAVLILAAATLWRSLDGSRETPPPIRSTAASAAESEEPQRSPAPLATLAEPRATLARHAAHVSADLRASIDLSVPAASTPPVFEVAIEGPDGERSAIAHFQTQPGTAVVHPVEEPGRYSIRASAPGWICETRWITVRTGVQPPEVHLLAAPGRWVEGTVVDEHRTPVANAEVLVLDGSGPFPHSATSDALGQFEISLPDRADRRDAELIVLASKYQPGRQMISADETQTIVVLARGWSVSGQVVDQDNRPVPDAEIHWKPRARVSSFEQRWIRSQAARSDRRGEFLLEGITPGMSQVSAEHPAYTEARYRLTPGAERTVTLRLTSGSEVSGFVHSEAKAPLPQSEITLVSTEHRERSLTATTGPDGEFRYESVPPGRYVISAERPGFAPTGREIEVPIDAPIELVVGRPAILVGEVWTAERPRYTLELSDLDGQVKMSEIFEDTIFEVGDLPAGDFIVTIAAEGSPAEEVAVVSLMAGEVTDLGSIMLSGGSQLSGQIVSADDASGQAARCSLSRLTHATGRYQRVGQYETDGTGRFTFTGLKQGNYRLIVAPHLAAQRIVDDIQIDGTAALDLGTLEVQSGATLSVLVLGFDGEPLAGTSISIGDRRGGYTGRTDATGRCIRTQLRPGLCSASLLVDGIPYRVHGTTRAGETTELLLSLRDEVRSAWTGHLLESSGRPSAGSTLLAVAEDGSWRSGESTADARGRFVLEGRLEGAAVLEVWGLRDGFPPVSLTTQFAAPGQGPSEVELPSASLRGTMPSGARSVRLVHLAWSAAGNPGYLRRRGERFASATAEAGGEFELQYLLPGDYRLEWLDERGTTVGEDSVSLSRGESIAWSGPPAEVAE